MSMMPTDPRQVFLQQIHERPKRFLHEWIGVPAHIHHVAYRMTNPALERDRTREEFEQLLSCLNIPDADSFIGQKLGYGSLTHPSGDRLVVVWEAHTEYYSYQVWHIADDPSRPLHLGPLTFPDFEFPFAPMGLRINALDILVQAETAWSADTIRMMLPGARVYGSRVFGEDISVFTSFTPDDDGRERYLVTTPGRDMLHRHMLQIIDGITMIENYYHLILLPFPDFGKAVDRIQQLEHAHLGEQAMIIEQLPTATAPILTGWVNQLSTGFLEVNRLSESMRYKLAAAVPYATIVKSNFRSFMEEPRQPFRPLSDYVFNRISGVTDGYQQLSKRIQALQGDVQNLVAMIRTRAELLLQEQNVHLLRNMDKTTTNQALLQHTVEALSVIVIAYYLTGLSSYVWKALAHTGWIADDATASGLTVPAALLVSSLLIWLGRRVIAKHLRFPASPAARDPGK